MSVERSLRFVLVEKTINAPPKKNYPDESFTWSITPKPYQNRIRGTISNREIKSQNISPNITSWLNKKYILNIQLNIKLYFLWELQINLTLKHFAKHYIKIESNIPPQRKIIYFLKKNIKTVLRIPYQNWIEDTTSIHFFKETFFLPELIMVLS